MATARPPSKVAGQPIAATVTAAAASGRRAATRSAVARTNPKIAQRTSECISGLRRLERQEDGIEVDDTVRSVLQGLSEHARHETAQLPRLGAEREPRGSHRRAETRDEPTCAGRNERGQQCEGRDDDTVSHVRAPVRGSATSQ